MKPSNIFTLNIKNGIAHLLVLLIFTILCVEIFNNASENIRLLDLLNPITIIAAFYVHTFILLPILIKKKKLKKYLFITISNILLVAFIIIFIEANRSSIITIRTDGSLSKPSDFYFDKRWVIDGILIAIIAFIPFSFCSAIYYLLIINKEQRKELFSFKYTEFIINIFLFLSLLLVFTANSYELNESIKNALLLLLFSIYFYCNTFIFSKYFIIDKRKFKYLFVQLISFVIAYVLVQLIYGYYIVQITYPFYNLLEFVLVCLFALILSHTYSYIRLKLKANEQLFLIKLDAKESELDLLKSQVNPHFLFNSLNTLYATALEEKADNTAESIAKLARLIRYMQEDIHKDFISLQNEINYVKDYITIQELRCAIKPKIKTEFINVDKHQISPGLLIPFVENAFKYGINPTKESTLKVSVICNEESIYFECVNSYDNNFKTYYKEQGFGIGIKNAQKRLELVYPKKHTFEVIKEENIFQVNISIKTK